MLTSPYHLDVEYPAKVSFLWPSAGFFEMLSGEDGADSCSKKQEIDYLVMYVSRGLHPDKKQWLVTEIIKCETRYGLR
jgi:hypothetical protein